MFLTYQTYLLSIETVNTKDPNLNLDLDLESYDEWDQYFDIETQTIINSKNKNYYILKPYIQFRQLPSNKFFKRKNQKQKQKQKSNLNIDILESIKEEEPEIFEDIETGKIETNKQNANINTKVYLYLMNLQNIILTSLIYISHVALIVLLIRI